jgi:hypothetical protein
MRPPSNCDANSREESTYADLPVVAGGLTESQGTPGSPTPSPGRFVQIGAVARDECVSLRPRPAHELGFALAGGWPIRHRSTQ